MESATHGSFSVTAAALKTQPEKPRWSLLKDRFSIRCEVGKLEFDLGAIGKGFALDRMAEVLQDWDCGAFLRCAGCSSFLAFDAPHQASGLSCGFGEDHSPRRYCLKNASLS